MLLLSMENELALQVLSTYEALVIEYEGQTPLITVYVNSCMVSFRFLQEMQQKQKPASSLQNPSLGDTLGYDNDYMKSVYRYLHNLYARWQKPEQALEYKKKYLVVCNRLSK